jgi:hypothetical protein
VAAFLFVRWPALLRPVIASDSNIDSAFFAYAGESVRLGGTPYLSFWDHKTPLIYLLDAMALTVSGGRVWGLWLLSLVAFVGAVVLGYRAMRSVFGSRGALLGTAYFACSLAILLPMNMTEGYVLPLEWGAILVGLGALRSHGGDRSMLRSGLALGVLGTLAFLLRPNLIGGAAAASLAVGFTLLLERRSRGVLALVVGIVVASLVVLGIIVGYLVHGGALAAFRDEVFHYNAIYASTTLGMRLRAAVNLLEGAGRLGSILIPLLGWVLAVRRVWLGRRAVTSLWTPWAVALLAVVWLPVEIVLASTSGRSYGHYFATMLAPLAFASALLAAELVHAVRVHGQEWLAQLPAVAAAGIVAFSGVTGVIRLRDADISTARSAEVTAMVSYVESRTPPGAPLLVWGHAADVYYFSHRPPASRFIYPLPLLTAGYADSAMVAGFLREIRASAPPLIIDATPNAPEGEDLVPSLAAWDPNWSYPKDGGPKVRWWSMTPALRSFYDFVRTEYVAVDTVGAKRWVVYRRITSPPPVASRMAPAA